MFETLVITFREGLEAFLIVAIMAAYLIKTGRKNLMMPLSLGVATALLISATTGWHIADLANDPLWEGSLAMAAGAMVATFTFFIMKNSRNIKSKIHGSLDSHSQKSGFLSAVGVFIFTTLMIAREGMETALMLGSISAQANANEMMVGAMVGLVSVAAIGWLWVKQSDKINLRLFMRVTGVFLILFAFDLFVYGVHELSETSSIPLIGESLNEFLYINTKIFSKSSIYSQVITYSLILVPLGWLGFSFLSQKMTVAK